MKAKAQGPLAVNPNLQENIVAAKEMGALAPPGPGRGHKKEKGVDNINGVSKGGTSQSYLVGRIQRDHPEIFAR